MKDRINTHIIQRFKKIVTNFPNKIAIEEMGRKITYRQLDKQSNRISTWLLRQGLTVGEGVVLKLPRNIDTMILILAIIKIKCYYLPIPKDSSLEFIDNIIKHKLGHIIISDKVIDNFTSKVINYNDIRNRKILHYENSLAFDINYDYQSKDCAYLIFTSGTTGKPKSIRIFHSSVTNLVLNQNYVRIESQDTILCLSPLSFDGSTFEIWGALLNGAKLVIYPDEMPVLSKISSSIEIYGISIVFLTTQLFNSMVDNRPETLVKVQKILFGGEQASYQHIKKFLRYSPSYLANVYGPTECTTFSTYYAFKDFKLNSNIIPIGKPITGIDIFLMNNNGERITKSNTPGEIVIGGEGVGMDVANYFESIPPKNLYINKINKNLYRTGDVAFYDQDKNLVFLHRKNRIIKIRGYRVNLQMIEEEIISYPNVKNAAVKFNKAYIIAWICPQNTMFNLQSLKKTLQFKFHPTMVPSKYHLIQNFKLTKNGKINYEELQDE